jgi:hypothetical protein
VPHDFAPFLRSFQPGGAFVNFAAAYIAPHKNIAEYKLA